MRKLKGRPKKGGGGGGKEDENLKERRKAPHTSFQNSCVCAAQKKTCADLGTSLHTHRRTYLLARALAHMLGIISAPYLLSYHICYHIMSAIISAIISYLLSYHICYHIISAIISYLLSSNLLLGFMSANIALTHMRTSVRGKTNQ